MTETTRFIRWCYSIVETQPNGPHDSVAQWVIERFKFPILSQNQNQLTDFETLKSVAHYYRPDLVAVIDPAVAAFRAS